VRRRCASHAARADAHRRAARNKRAGAGLRGMRAVCACFCSCQCACWCACWCA
jgi:hypothetical protein